MARQVKPGYDHNTGGSGGAPQQQTIRRHSNDFDNPPNLAKASTSDDAAIARTVVDHPFVSTSGNGADARTAVAREFVNMSVDMAAAPNVL